VPCANGFSDCVEVNRGILYVWLVAGSVQLCVPVTSYDRLPSGVFWLTLLRNAFATPVATLVPVWAAAVAYGLGGCGASGLLMAASYRGGICGGIPCGGICGDIPCGGGISPPSAPAIIGWGCVPGGIPCGGMPCCGGIGPACGAAPPAGIGGGIPCGIPCCGMPPGGLAMFISACVIWSRWPF
jgi:hypothetical protein